MSRQGNCWDNAVMESFYSRLKVELIYAEEDTQRWGTSAQLSTKVCSYVLSTFCGVHHCSNWFH